MQKVYEYENVRETFNSKFNASSKCDSIIKELENMKVEEVISKANDWMFDKNKRKSVSILIFGNENLSVLKSFVESDSDNKKVVKSIEELMELRDSLQMFDYKR